MSEQDTTECDWGRVLIWEPPGRYLDRLGPAMTTARAAFESDGG